MKRSNIDEVLDMVEEYLRGEMDAISFVLDFPHEVTQRYQKMRKEDPEWTDMIYVYLLEQGADLYHSMSEPKFRALIQRQYNNVVEGAY